MKKKDISPNCLFLYLQGDHGQTQKYLNVSNFFCTEGNAGNPLDRISVFQSLIASSKQANPVILAPAPRSYWTSTTRSPTQQGIITDYMSALAFALQKWPSIPVVLYGHSLGGSVAVCLLEAIENRREETSFLMKDGLDFESLERIKGLVLENPFSSIPGMVHALYPQKWLPYRYLTPFAWDKWDALRAMRNAKTPIHQGFTPPNIKVDSYANSITTERVLSRLARNMLVMVSEKDEVVPRSMGISIFEEASQIGSWEGRDHDEKKRNEAKLIVIERALHEDAFRRKQWGLEISRYLDKVISK